MAKPITGAEDVRWDLSFLYSGLDDPRIKADIDAWCEAAKAFHDRFKGKLATELGAAITAKAELKMQAEKPMDYLFLRQSLKTDDSIVKGLLADASKRLSEADGNWMEFFIHELVALDETAIAALAEKDEVVKKHLPWIAKLRLFKTHLLPEAVESALTKRQPLGADSWSEFFDEVESDLRFPWNGDQVTMPEVLHVLTESTDPKVRAAALKVLNDGFKGPFAKYSAQALSMVTAAKEIEDRERGFASPMQSVNLGNQIPDAVVESLHETVNGLGGELARDYYRFKAQLLGLPRLAWSDRNAPMPFKDVSVTPWAKAMEIVLASYQSFSPTLADLIREMVAKNRIDAAAIPGKRGGAFNASLVLPGGTPASFTFMSYLGSGRDVSTLSHEVGHGGHGILAGEAQGPLMQHAPIPFCETASVFGEKVTFDYLKAELVAKGDDASLLALLLSKLDDMMNTVVRQISFSNFERAVHGARRKLGVEELNRIWLEQTYAMYGQPGDVFTYDDTDHLWSYVSHFHRPFYVYGYAFGELFTHSLYAKQAELGDRFEPLYLDLLRSGGTRDAQQLMAPFGLDPTHPDFWAAGIRVSMGALLDEAKTVARRLGKIA